MSTTERSLEDLLALEQPCTTCGSARGEWCRIRDGYRTAGTPASYLHVARTWTSRHAHQVGYTRGLEQAYAIALYDIDNPGVLGGEHTDPRAAIAARLEVATRWAQSAHQRALEDIPEGWKR